jgi:hypothetical protein
MCSARAFFEETGGQSTYKGIVEIPGQFVQLIRLDAFVFGVFFKKERAVVDNDFGGRILKSVFMTLSSICKLDFIY